ncbi:hypothetical protein H4R34_002547 [Dimargaris verticillata]|uniref:Protein tyrosine phosphatase type IVA 3 n=1 Tax=Dimargaris verticillata TaxID=2761393 RepID=A0A9W8E9W1_9FUNG|nr:hypothetical protein H4R34_002547 [Dimargaris verticillata]
MCIKTKSLPYIAMQLVERQLMAEAHPRRRMANAALPLGLPLVDYDGQLRFLITDCPTNSTLPYYLKAFKLAHVTDVVRVCDPTYSPETLVQNGINVHHYAFPDGHIPPNRLVRQWLDLVRCHAQDAQEAAATAVAAAPNTAPDTLKQTVVVHCVAGLGRAPVLVALALIDKGMCPMDTIELIRRKRPGALNNRQVRYLLGLSSTSLRKSLLHRSASPLTLRTSTPFLTRCMNLCLGKWKPSSVARTRTVAPVGLGNSHNGDQEVVSENPEMAKMSSSSLPLATKVDR